ncbi:hypothetical protein Cni_G20225 [Canna indica]|uniref:Uncharacterized protein n=1 Tax=Canna indica TaxID=4628 RepID=A0AAQ3KT22_9LILI|nr:hypothetical protein Cni_G20225 [Canna indica]
MKYMKQDRQPAETRGSTAISGGEVDEREVRQELAVSTLSSSSSSSLSTTPEQLSSEEETSSRV